MCLAGGYTWVGCLSFTDRNRRVEESVRVITVGSVRMGIIGEESVVVGIVSFEHLSLFFLLNLPTSERMIRGLYRLRSCFFHAH